MASMVNATLLLLLLATAGAISKDDYLIGDRPGIGQDVHRHETLGNRNAYSLFRISGLRTMF